MDLGVLGRLVHYALLYYVLAKVIHITIFHPNSHQHTFFLSLGFSFFGLTHFFL